MCLGAAGEKHRVQGSDRKRQGGGKQRDEKEREEELKKSRGKVGTG